MATTMTPRHSLWRMFIEQMEKMNVCRGGIKRPRATAILLGMRNINVKKSLEYFSKHGGYCDCEVIMNCDAKYRRHKLIGMLKKDGDAIKSIRKAMGMSLRNASLKSGLSVSVISRIEKGKTVLMRKYMERIRKAGIIYYLSYEKPLDKMDS